jgi:hypothetical protein
MSVVLTYDWNGHTDRVVQSPEKSNIEVACRVRMLMRSDLDHESVCTLARDRIMGLDKRIGELLTGLRSILDRADNGELGTSKVQDMRRIAAALLAKHGGAS